MTILVLKANYCDDWGSPIGNLHMSSQDLPKHSSRTAASCCCWLLSCRMRFLRGPVKPWNRETVKPTKKAGVKPHLGGKSDRKNGGLMASQCVSVFVHVFSPTKNGGLRKQMRGLLKELQWAERRNDGIWDQATPGWCAMPVCNGGSSEPRKRLSMTNDCKLITYHIIT